jgi:hypothetical protein
MFCPSSHTPSSMTLARSKPRTLTTPAAPSYAEDLHAWAIEQAHLLRAGQTAEIDCINLAEEIEALARLQFDKLASFVGLVIMHMLKWDHQPWARSRSWVTSILNHRSHAEDVLSDNPSLKPRWDEAVARAYKTARRNAANEMGVALASLPAACPYSREEIMERPFDPDSFLSG